MALAPAAKKPAEPAPAAAPARPAAVQAAAAPGAPLYMQAAGLDPQRDTPTTADKGAGADLGGAGVVSAASAGVSGAAAPLPHVDKIQAAFGAHDVSGVRAAVGGDAGATAKQLGARAYTVGDRVAFREDPDLRLAAHEAAHVVQQRGGVQLKDGVGRPGDHYERQADAVADAVVAGHSAEGMLGAPGGGGGGGARVQMACASCGGGGGGCPSCSGETPVVQMELDPLATRHYEPPLGMPAPDGGGGGGAGHGPAQGKGKGGGDAQPGQQQGQDAQQGQQQQAPAPGGDQQQDPVAKMGAQLGDLRCPQIPEAPQAEGGGEKPDEEPCHEDPDYFKPISAEQRAEDERKAKAGELKSPDEPKGVDVKAKSAPPQKQDDAKGGGDKPPEPETPAECKPDEQPKQTPPPAPQEQPEEPLQVPKPDPALAEAILAGEQSRAAAVADLDGADAETARADDRLRDVGSTTVRFAPAGEDVEAQQRHARATEIASRGVSEGVTESRDALAELRPQIPARIAAKLALSKQELDRTCDHAKQEIRGEFAAARASAHREATLSKIMVDLHYMLAMVKAMVATVTTASAIDSDKTAKMAEASRIEGEKLGALDTAVTEGQNKVETTGRDRGEDAMKKGRSWSASYSAGRPFPSDGFWEGHVTDRRAEARAKAALTTAGGYRDSFKQEAENQKHMIARGKQPKCAQIVASAFATRVGIAQNGAKFAQLVRDALPGQLDTLKGARTDFRAAIDKALHKQLLTLKYQEHAQLQAADDTCYAQKLTLEQQAHAGAARLVRSVTRASDDIAKAFGQMRETLEGHDPPEPDALQKAIDGARAQVRGILGRIRDDIHGGLDGADSSLDEQTTQSGDALRRLADGAVDQADESAAGFSEQMSGLRERIGTTFADLATAYQGQLDAIHASATKAFACALASLRQVGDNAVKEVTEGAKSISDSLEKSFQEELGKVDEKIQLYACKAAEKEQPAWKEVLAVVLIIIIMIVAIIVFGPLAAALGAALGSAFAGAVVAGAIIGALSAAATTILNNWADGQTWHKGVVKAMVVGAITGAIGGAFGGGAGGGWVGRAGSFLGQVGRQVVADFVGSMVGQVLGGLIVDHRLEMPHYSVKDFMMSVFMASLFARGKIPKRMTEGPGVRARALRGFEHVQDFAHGVAGSLMPGGKLRPGTRAAEAGGGAPGEGAGGPHDTPVEVPPSRPNERPGAPEARTPEAAPEHGQPVEKPGGEPARPEQSLHEARAAERTAHPDAPEIEPGTNVVARESSVGDHTVSVTRDGKVVVCSTCGELARVFEPEIAEFGLHEELIRIEGMADPKAKAAAAARLHAKLVGLRNIANRANGAPVTGGDPSGALARVRGLATEMGMPEAVVARHVQELTQFGRHPQGVSPHGPYGQKLLALGEAVVGARIEARAPTTHEPTTGDVIGAKAEADLAVKAKLGELGETIGQRRAAADPKTGPTIEGAIENVADVTVNEPTQGGQALDIGTQTIHKRSSMANEGNRVIESARGEGNLFIEGRLGTYKEIEARAARYAEELGMTPEEFMSAFVETIQTGRTPKLTGNTGFQGRVGRFMSRVQRLLFASEVIRSPTQLSDTAQALRLGSEQGGFSRVRESIPSAAVRSPKGTPSAERVEGGATGSKGAYEREFFGSERRADPTERAIDEAVRRHESQLPEHRYRGMTRQQMRDAFIADIVTRLFGGRQR